ncbi:MAG: phage baseplate upper protein, partial [Eubacterium sp.]|nr:phage baseplate upper protein [Eubacterium sp.]
MKYIQNITLDVNCNPANYQYINAKQCDNASRVLKVTLTSNNQQIKPETGTEAIFRCLKPDGNSCVNPAVINADGTVTVEFTKQELAVKGVTLADISLIKNETVLSTVSFRILVDEAPVSVSKVKSSGEFLILLDTIKAAETAIEKAAIAANEAKSATEAAIMARRDSDSSTAAANEAANLAHAAKTEAEEAAEKADTAANSAISAAESVDNAKENANAAANNANAAAERVEKAVQATETVIDEANAASENAQDLTELLTEKLNNGEFIGAQGEKGDDGFSPIVTVTSSDNGHNVTITDSKGDKSFDVFNGEQGIPGEDGKDYILTESDKKDIADLAVENAAEAANNANSAAQTAQGIVDLINEKLADGEFNGAD